MKNKKQNQSPPSLSRSDKRKVGALIGVIVLATVLLIVYITRDTDQRLVEITDDSESMENQISEGLEDEEERVALIRSDGDFSFSFSEKEKEESSFGGEISKELPPKENPPEKGEKAGRKEEPFYQPEILKEPPQVETEISVRPAKESLEEESLENHPGLSSQESADDNRESSEKRQQFEGMALGQQILKASPYDRQKMGNAPVFFYQHPNQSMGIDLRAEPEKASSLYVLPTEKGFVIMDRHLMALHHWSEEDIRQNLLKGKVVPGLVDVRLVSEKEAEEMKKDSKLESLIEEKGKGQVFVFSRAKENAWMMDSLLTQLGEQAIDLSFVQNILSPDGLIGRIDPPKGEDPEKEFSALQKKLQSDPAKVEWLYQLPLYGPGNYKVGGRDLRRDIPERAPVYQCGVADLNGDGFPEYVIHASMSQEKKSGLQGYYAILTPSPTGLITTEVIYHGNGPLIKNGKTLLTASQSEKEGTKILQIAQNPYPPGGQGWIPAEVHFLQPQGLGKSLTGKELARLYPDHYLVPHEGTLYLVPLGDYDMLMDFALNRLSGGTEVFLKDADDPQQVPAFRIKDPAAYLAQKFPDLPFSQEDWSKAQPAGMFRADPMPITVEDLVSGKGKGKGVDQKNENKNPSPAYPLPDDPMNPAIKQEKK